MIELMRSTGPCLLLLALRLSFCCWALLSRLPWAFRKCRIVAGSLPGEWITACKLHRRSPLCGDSSVRPREAARTCATVWLRSLQERLFMIMLGLSSRGHRGTSDFAAQRPTGTCSDGRRTGEMDARHIAPASPPCVVAVDVGAFVPRTPRGALR